MRCGKRLPGSRAALSDHRDVVKLERVDEVIDQPLRVLSNMSAPEDGRVRHAVAGQLHGEQSQVRKLG